MYKFCIIIALVATFVRADDEPFSIGLGVLSPSYSQTVGKENVKVNFEQKDDGFSYSVGDPASGTNTYLNFGAAASGQAVNPAGYADANPSGYAGASPSGYTGGSPSGYAGASPSGYAGASPSGYAGASPSGYAGASPSGYAGASPSGYAGASPSGYAGVNPSAYTGPSASSGFAGIQSNPSYGGLSGYQPSYGAGASSGLGASGFSSGNGLIGSAGHAGFFNGAAASPASPSGYSGESPRKPEETPSQILPAGFSYHGTDGQSFLRQGDSPNFVIDEGKESARGPAEQSFYDNFRASGAEGSKKVLTNGLVGYGPGGPRGNVPVGGFAGPQFSGVFREHGGHTAQDTDAYSG